MSPARHDPVDPPTDPAVPAGRRRGSIGDLDVKTAGALELARGGLTSGAAVLIFYQLLRGDLQEVRDDVAGLRAQLTGDVAALRVDMQALRVDVTRLQVQVEPPKRPSP